MKKFLLFFVLLLSICSMKLYGMGDHDDGIDRYILHLNYDELQLICQIMKGQGQRTVPDNPKNRKFCNTVLDFLNPTPCEYSQDDEEFYGQQNEDYEIYDYNNDSDTDDPKHNLNYKRLWKNKYQSSQHSKCKTKQKHLTTKIKTQKCPKKRRRRKKGRKKLHRKKKPIGRYIKHELDDYYEPKEMRGSECCDEQDINNSSTSGYSSSEYGDTEEEKHGSLLSDYDFDYGPNNEEAETSDNESIENMRYILWQQGYRESPIIISAIPTTNKKRRSIP